MVPAGQSRLEWQIVSDLDQILLHKQRLCELSARCLQTGSLNFLDYFLAAPYFDLAVPEALIKAFRFLPERLLKRRARRPVLLLGSDRKTLQAAVLLFEYSVMGLPTRCFVPLDDDGYRCVIAPEEEKNRVAIEAGTYLVKRGALMALISALKNDDEEWVPFALAAPLLGTQRRRVARRFLLRGSMEETFAAMSRNLRHNLRRSRGHLVQDFGATYVPDAVVSLPELMELNQSCIFRVPDWVAAERYASARGLEFGYVAGLRDRNGRWNSLIGAHREADTLCLDWQINRSGLGSISVTTAMRSFLIEDEIRRGTRWIRFERGTTHPIQGAFRHEVTYDWLFASQLLPSRLIQRMTRNAKGGALSTVLASPTMNWRS